MKGDIWEVIGATASAVTGVVIMAYKVDPFTTSIGLLSLFYFTLTLSIWGSITLISYSFRRFTTSNFIHKDILTSSFLQGLFISLGLTIFLIINKFI